MTPTGTRLFLLTGSGCLGTQFWWEKSAIFGRKELGYYVPISLWHPESHLWVGSCIAAGTLLVSIKLEWLFEVNSHAVTVTGSSWISWLSSCSFWRFLRRSRRSGWLCSVIIPNSPSSSTSTLTKCACVIRYDSWRTLVVMLTSQRHSRWSGARCLQVIHLCVEQSKNEKFLCVYGKVVFLRVEKVKKKSKKQIIFSRHISSKSRLMRISQFASIWGLGYR